MASKDGPERAAKARMEPKYHVYVRLPFNRGDFVDPPPVRLALCILGIVDRLTNTRSKVNWDDKKSEALWAIISGVSETEIDCLLFPPPFDESLPFY